MLVLLQLLSIRIVATLCWSETLRELLRTRHHVGSLGLVLVDEIRAGVLTGFAVQVVYVGSKGFLVDKNELFEISS